MKLLYLWLENYNDKIVNQGFTFSPEYLIHFDNDLNKLFIKRNKKYISDFYGKNILDITAIVGENGAGKTTVAKCVYNICSSVIPVDDDIDEYKFTKIIVYLKHEESNNQNKELYIFYYSQEMFDKEIDKDIECEWINLHNMSANEFEHARKEHEMSVVYFTNAFDISHTIKNQGMGEFFEGDIRKSICISPMMMIKSEMYNIRESYGAQSKENGLYFDVIQQYAQKMGVSIEDAYASAFNYNFLLAVRHTPNSIAAILPVLSDFKLYVIEFGEYIANAKKIGMLSEFDKSIYFIRKNIYEKIIKFFVGNNWGKIYANILCEIIMFMNLLNGEHIDFDEIEKNACSIEKTEGFDIIANQISDLEKRRLVSKIRNVNKVDLSVLDDFFEIYEKEPVLKESKWYHQVKSFKSIYEDRHLYLSLPETINDGHIELIEILLNEHQNSETFWGRMLRIVPNPMSSGEVALINIFSSIYKVMTEQTNGNILLIIDEMDAYLHPKWQQSILTYIIRWINEGKDFKRKKVQVILSSHSPIILSDIPNDRVIYLKSLCCVTRQRNLTFGANINQLFYDSFFMEEGSIGNFSKYKIQKAIDYIGSKAKDISEEEVEYIIENIGEPFVKRKLQRDLNYKQFIEEQND